MPIRREFPPRTFEAADVKGGAADPLYARILTRLLAAHAYAEKLTAEGYELALQRATQPSLRAVIQKNMIEERRHASLIYHALAELGVSEAAADRTTITARKAPSFEAPRCFAQQPADEIELVMASLSLDMTGLLMIGVNYKDSSYAPHARAAEIILDEEADHDAFAAEGLHEAVNRHGKDAVNRGLREWVPRAANFFGPPGSGFTYDCIRLGLKARDNQELAELYLTMLERRLEHLGLAMPRLTAGYPRALAAD